MYSVSRKAFQQVINIISNEDLETSDKAEAICQIVEDEINMSNTQAKLLTDITQFANVWKEVLLDRWTAVDTEPQKIVPPSWEATETKAEKVARARKMAQAGMGQVDKEGNFTPFGRKLDLWQINRWD